MANTAVPNEAFVVFLWMEWNSALVHAQAEVEVEVDLDLNAHTNARAWHGDRKARSAKQAKTVEANERALAVAGKKAQQQLSKVGCLPACPALQPSSVLFKCL